ncbi:TonB-dependent receptor [Hugenholtzia roseola]|uniref:TonB-dependent receptor n=1 Tax=Hugenholtzia roseola TaxID=1002 RepID=UPI000A322D1F|nr:TonB-dependent receptor [Hugenholtzia roseola]
MRFYSKLRPAFIEAKSGRRASFGSSSSFFTKESFSSESFLGKSFLGSFLLALVACCFLCLNPLSAQEKRYTLSGSIKDNSNGEEIIGATVLVKELSGVGAVTNEYGFFSLTLPAGEYTILYQFLGYETQEEKINLTQNQTVSIRLGESAAALSEVVITDKELNENVESVQISKNTLDMAQVKKLPAVFGEVDVMRTITLLPGVQNAGEGTAGLFVRGGANDQNLILLDDAPVYNGSHLLGFFSVFNPDAVRDVQLYKAGIPTQYGGRLSSIIDVRMKNGSDQNFMASGGIGSISSRLTVESPIGDKASFMLSGRRTYADMFLKLSPDADLRQNRLYFYDFNAKVNLKIDDKNRIFLSGYFGRDVFGFGENFGLSWGNNTGTLRWNHIFNQKLFLNTTLIYSSFDYGFDVGQGVQNFTWKSGLQDMEIKFDFDYFLNPKNTLVFGMQNVYHRFTPVSITPQDETSIFQKFALDEKYALETALYIGNEQKISDRLMIQYGLRYSMFQNLGATREFVYEEGKPRSDRTITDTIHYKKFEPYSFYGGLEPRLSFRYKLDKNSSIKGAYNRTRQYIQTVSTNTASLPFDRWIGSNTYIPPQIGDQIALGYFRNLKENEYELSVEAYYKDMRNQIDVLDGADLFLNNNIEEALAAGRAWAYGAEFLLRKNMGKTTGWVSYTYSKVQRQIDGINAGIAYSPRYDRPHNLAIVVSHQFNDRVTLAGNFVYNTGAAVTYPVGRYLVGDELIPYYEEGKRNAYRLPAYHRADISLTIDGKNKKQRWWSGSWNFSLYNFYNRKNAFTIYFRPEQDGNGNPTNSGKTEAVKTTLFGIIPSVTYNFKIVPAKK